MLICQIRTDWLMVVVEPIGEKLPGHFHPRCHTVTTFSFHRKRVGFTDCSHCFRLKYARMVVSPLRIRCLSVVLERNSTWSETPACPYPKYSRGGDDGMASQTANFHPKGCSKAIRPRKPVHHPTPPHSAPPDCTYRRSVSQGTRSRSILIPE